MDKTYLDRIIDREKELANLRARQDRDKDLLYLAKYVMRDTNNHKVPDIIHVTLNRPAVFSANVISALGKTAEQVVVESERKNIDADYVEDFIRKAFMAANVRLRKRNKPELNAFFDEQVAIRGGCACRVAFQMVDGVLVPDLAEWDFRYVTWDTGRDGLDYASYCTNQSKNEVMGQSWYQGSEKRLVEKVFRGTNQKVFVRDVWDNSHNELWINEEKVFEQGHDWGFTPVALQQVSLGSMLSDNDAEEHHGESIFFLIRDVVPELNRLASIMQSLNLKAVKPPIQAKKRGGGEAPNHEDVAGMSSVTVIEPDEAIERVDYGDAQKSAELAYSMFDKALQEGSLTSIDLGRLDFELSAIALIELGEGRDQVFAPRLKTKALLNQEITEMFMSQCQKIGGSLEIGTPGHKRSFDMEKLNGEYDIKFEYFSKSPKLDMARYTMAAQAKTVGLPQRVIDEDILQRPDPDSDERQRRWEQAEMLSPQIRMHRIIKSLLEDAEKGDEDAEFEAELLSMTMGVSVQQMMTGQAQTPGIEETPKPTPGLGIAPGGVGAPTPQLNAPIQEGV